MSLEKAIADLAVAMNRVADSNILLAKSGGQATGAVVPFSEEAEKIKDQVTESEATTKEEPKETAAEKKKRIAKEKREAKAAEKKAKEEAEAEAKAAKELEGEEEEEAEKKATLADVRKAARPFIKANKATDIREILQDHGADNLKELEEEHFASVVKAISKLELPED